MQASHYLKTLSLIGLSVLVIAGCKAKNGDNGTDSGGGSDNGETTYTISLDIGTGGTITPATNQSIATGGSAEFTLTPDTGYTLDTVSGCAGTLTDATYQVENLTEDCTITASFKLQEYAVQLSIVGGGTTNSDTNQTIRYNQTTTFVLTALNGYQYTSTTASPASCGGSYNASNTTYTTNPITSDCHFTVTFSAESVAQTKQPNILLVLTDDQGIDSTNLYAYTKSTSVTAQTPILDGIAKNGVIFQNVWATPSCTTTRAALLSGQYGVNTGITNNGDENLFSDIQESIFQYITNNHASSDYKMAFFGKWNLGTATEPSSGPMRAGIDYFRGSLNGNLNGDQDYYSWNLFKDPYDSNAETQTEVMTEYATSYLTNQAIAWVQNNRQNNPDAPWFVTLSHFAPHAPIHLPPPELHHQEDIKTLKNCSRASSWARHCYIASIEAVDTELGNFLNSLTEQERANTIVVYLGDNGPGAEADPLVMEAGEGKFSMFEGGLRVPLIVGGDQVTKNSSDNNNYVRDQDLVGITDVFATIAELAGAPTTNGSVYNGLSFASKLIDTNAADAPDYAAAVRAYLYVDWDDDLAHLSQDTKDLIKSPHDTFDNTTISVVDGSTLNGEIFDGWSVRNDAYQLISIRTEVDTSDNTRYPPELALFKLGGETSLYATGLPITNPQANQEDAAALLKLRVAGALVRNEMVANITQPRNGFPLDVSAGTDYADATYTFQSDTGDQSGDFYFTDRTPSCAAFIGNYEANITQGQNESFYTSQLTVDYDGGLCTFVSNWTPNHNIFTDEGRANNYLYQDHHAVAVPAAPQYLYDDDNPGLEFTRVGQAQAVYLNGVQSAYLPGGCYYAWEQSPGSGYRANFVQECRFSDNDTIGQYRWVANHPDSAHEVDNHNGHTAGHQYHYHGNPKTLYDLTGTEESGVVGFASDGFPIYGPYIKENGVVRLVKTSYQIKKGIRPPPTHANGDSLSQYNDKSGNPLTYLGFDRITDPVTVRGVTYANGIEAYYNKYFDGDDEYNGAFISDYEYVKGSGDLDLCNGMWRNGSYGYYLTDAWPHSVRCFRGDKHQSFQNEDDDNPIGNSNTDPNGDISTITCAQRFYHIWPDHQHVPTREHWTYDNGGASDTDCEY